MLQQGWGSRRLFAGRVSSAMMAKCSLQDHPPGKSLSLIPGFCPMKWEGQLRDDNQLLAPEELKLEIQIQENWNACEWEAWRGYLVSLSLTLIPGTYWMEQINGEKGPMTSPPAAASSCSTNHFSCTYHSQSVNSTILLALFLKWDNWNLGDNQLQCSQLVEICWVSHYYNFPPKVCLCLARSWVIKNMSLNI